MQRLYFFKKNYICNYERKCVNQFNTNHIFNKCKSFLWQVRIIHLKTSFNAVLFDILNKFVVNNENFMTVVMYNGCTIAFLMLYDPKFYIKWQNSIYDQKEKKNLEFKKVQPMNIIAHEPNFHH